MQNIKKNLQSSWTQKMLALVVEYQIQLIQKLYKNVSAYSVLLKFKLVQYSSNVQVYCSVLNGIKKYFRVKSLGETYKNKLSKAVPLFLHSAFSGNI